jgi:hypothetical protein
VLPQNGATALPCFSDKRAACLQAPFSSKKGLACAEPTQLEGPIERVIQWRTDRVLRVLGCAIKDEAAQRLGLLIRFEIKDS